MTLKSSPKNFSIVFAFAGLSTITKFSCISALRTLFKGAKLNKLFAYTLYNRDFFDFLSFYQVFVLLVLLSLHNEMAAHGLTKRQVGHI